LKKGNLPYWAEPEGPTQPRSARRRPTRSPSGPGHAGVQGGHGRPPPTVLGFHAKAVPRPRPYLRPVHGEWPPPKHHCRPPLSKSGASHRSPPVVSTSLRSPRSPLSVLRLGRAPSCLEPWRFEMPKSSCRPWPFL
jgi:hypothetical protein